MIYVINLLFLVLYGIIVKLLFPKLHNRIFLFISTIHVSLFHALRDPYVYPDNDIYASNYINISKVDLHSLIIETYMGWEPGYVLYNFMLSKISENPEYLFISSSLFMVIGYMIIIRKYSFMPFVSVMIYLLYPLMFCQSLFVLRQHIATIIMLYAIYSIVSTKKFFLISLIAFCFHYSALVVFPFYFIYRKNIINLNPRKIFIYILIFFAFVRFLFVTVVNLFPRYSDYETPEGNMIPFTLLASLLFMSYMLNIYKLVKFEYEKITLSFLFYGTIIVFLMLGVPGGGRLSNYFIYIMPIAYPLLFKYNKSSKSKFLRVAYSVFYWGVIFFMAINSGMEKYEYSLYF